VWVTHALPPVLLMAFIYWLGTDRASAQETGSFILRTLSWLALPLAERLGPEGLAALNVGMRKTGHFLGYALLAFLNARALKRMTAIPWGPAAFAGALVWAAVDEYHQSFSSSRGASAWDVLLDAFGAAAGILIHGLWMRRATPSA
jgi:VanZ family protein